MSHKIKARHACCPLWWTQAPKLLNRSSPHLLLQAPSGLLHIHPTGSGPWGKWNCSHSVVSDSLWPHGLQPARLLCPWKSPGKNTGVGYHSLLQGIFLTLGLNPGLPPCKQMLYPLSHQGSPHKCWLSCNPITMSSLPLIQVSHLFW